MHGSVARNIRKKGKGIVNEPQIVLEVVEGNIVREPTKHELVNHVFWCSFPIASIFTGGLYKLNNAFPMEHVFGKRLLLVGVKLVYQFLNFFAVIGRITSGFGDRLG